MKVIPYCPKCGQLLSELSEEFRSINVYLYNNGQYEEKEVPIENLEIKCKRCGYVLPVPIVRLIEELLPRPTIKIEE